MFHGVIKRIVSSMCFADQWTWEAGTIALTWVFSQSQWYWGTASSHIYFAYILPLPPSHTPISCHTLVSQWEHKVQGKQKRPCLLPLKKKCPWYYLCSSNYFLIYSSNKTHLVELNVYRNKLSDDKEEKRKGVKEFIVLHQKEESLDLFRVEWNGPLMV